MQQSSKFSHTPTNPYHISVGAVIRRENGDILCHTAGPEIHGMGDFQGYLLMRETLEDNESLEAAVARGMEEEFGVRGTIERYLGTITCVFHQASINTDVEKSTPYFLVKYDGELGSGPTTDDEAEKPLKPEWKTAAFLIEKGKEQAKLANRPDIDESTILERL